VTGYKIEMGRIEAFYMRPIDPWSRHKVDVRGQLHLSVTSSPMNCVGLFKCEW